jgi:hypothetical protein
VLQILLTAAYTALFIFIIYRWKFFHVEGIPANLVKAVFILKVVAGCVLGFIYTYYYTEKGDTIKFFDDSSIIYNAFYTSPKGFFEMFTGINGDAPHLFSYYNQMEAWNNKDVLFNDNKTLIRLNVLFHFFSLSKYYVHVVFLNFLSFIGLIALFKLFQSYLKNKSVELFFGVMLLPSVLFWGSGMLKDGLLLFGMGMMLYTFNKIINREKSFKNIAVFAALFILLIFTKLYTIVCIFPGLIAWYWSRKDGAKKIALKFLLCYGAYLLIGFNIGLINTKYDVSDIIYFKQKNFYDFARQASAKSMIEIPIIEPNAWSLLINSPGAILRVLTRPSLFDSHAPLILLAAVENLVILAIILFCIIKAKRNGNVNLPIFWFSVFFFITMFALIGLITPVLGAIVRYKVPVLPFLMFIMLALYNKPQAKPTID